LVDIGYYRTVRELVRTLLFHVQKKTAEEEGDWEITDNVGMWPKFLQALCLFSPTLDGQCMWC
jgi:hypothetical protein